jgi:hypothetical protein
LCGKPAFFIAPWGIMVGSNFDILIWAPPWVTCVVLFGVLMAAAAVGRRVGLAATERDLSTQSFDLSVVEGALFGLLGLLIAFTYSFVMIRDDHRKSAIIGEANAIGTAYLRADLAPEPARGKLRDLLRQYTRTRIISPGIARSPERYNAALAESLAVQAKLWPTAVGSLSGRTPTVTDALLLGSINEVIDSHGRRLAANRDRLPSVVFLMLVAVALVSVGLTGYAGGIANNRKEWRTTTIAATVSVVMLIILDLDQPRSGFIQVSQQIMVDTLDSMGPPPAPAATRPSSPLGAGGHGKG